MTVASCCCLFDFNIGVTLRYAFALIYVGEPRRAGPMRRSADHIPERGEDQGEGRIRLHARATAHPNSGSSAPMGELLAPLAQVPRKPREKETGAGGVTTQADCVQQCTALGSPGKIGGTHARWNWLVSASERQWMHGFHRAASFCLCVFGCIARDILGHRLAVTSGGYPPCHYWRLSRRPDAVRLSI
jgi:hypothetical protein